MLVNRRNWNEIIAIVVTINWKSSLRGKPISTAFVSISGINLSQPTGNS